jgi:hypothetical protein
VRDDGEEVLLELVGFDEPLPRLVFLLEQPGVLDRRGDGGREGEHQGACGGGEGVDLRCVDLQHTDRSSPGDERHPEVAADPGADPALAAFGVQPWIDGDVGDVGGFARGRDGAGHALADGDAHGADLGRHGRVGRRRHEHVPVDELDRAATEVEQLPQRGQRLVEDLLQVERAGDPGGEGEQEAALRLLRVRPLRARGRLPSGWAAGRCRPPRRVVVARGPALTLGVAVRERNRPGRPSSRPDGRRRPTMDSDGRR